jgi:hypothetical protein
MSEPLRAEQSALLIRKYPNYLAWLSLFAAAGLLWAFLTNTLIMILTDDPIVYRNMSMAKDALGVAIAAAWIASLLIKHRRQHHQTNHLIQTLLTASPGTAVTKESPRLKSGYDESFFHAVLEALPYPVFIQVGKNQQWLHNGSARDLLGLPKDALPTDQFAIELILDAQSLKKRHNETSGCPKIATAYLRLHLQQKTCLVTTITIEETPTTPRSLLCLANND